MNVGFDAKRAFHNKTGLGNYSRDILRILSKFYPENKYFLFNPKERATPLFQTFSNQFEIFPKSKFWKKFSSLWRQKAIVKQLVENDIAIYHGLSGELPRGIKKTSINTVVTIHDLIFVRYPKLYSYFDRKIHFNKFQYAANSADVVVAISEQTKKDIVSFLKIPSEKIKVLYQGCNAAFKKEYDKNRIQQTVDKYNLPANFILNVGTVEERKNLLTLVKAVKNIENTLVIVGNDSSAYASKVKKYIEDAGMSQRVSFLKNVTLEELAIIYRLATVFVYPSIFEGFGIPIIEALYSKTAVITSKEGCFSEAGGFHSIYVDPLEVIEIQEAIMQVLNDEKKRVIMETKGLEYAQQFNDTVIAKKMLSLYDSILINQTIV